MIQKQMRVRAIICLDPPLTSIGEVTEVTIFAVSARYRDTVSSSRLVKPPLNGPSKNASCTALQMLDPRDPSLTPTTSTMESKGKRLIK